jgi:hypothetical protein
MRRPREFVVDQADALVHEQRIVRTWIAVNERQPWTRIDESRRQKLQFARGRSAAYLVRDKFGLLFNAPSRKAADLV